MSKLYNGISTALFWLTLLSLTALLLSQLLGRSVWQLELFSHYVPHVAILTLLAAIVYPRRAKSSDLYARLYRSRLIRIAFLIVATLLLGWCLTPLSLIIPTFSTSQDNSEDNAISIAYQNVNIANKAAEQTVKQLTQTSPDVLILIEAGGTVWQPSTQQLSKQYQHHCGVDQASPFAMQVFVGKKTIELTQEENGKANTMPRCEIVELSGYALAKVYLADGRVIYAAHPPPPISRNLARDRNRYVNELAVMIKNDASESILVVGDFNLSGFSPIYREFIGDSSQNNSGLHRATLSGLPTWSPFAIGIDQILVKGNSQQVTSMPLGWQGSDHRGFLITLH